MSSTDQNKLREEHKYIQMRSITMSDNERKWTGIKNEMDNNYAGIERPNRGSQYVKVVWSRSEGHASSP